MYEVSDHCTDLTKIKIRDRWEFGKRNIKWEVSQVLVSG